MTYRLAADFIFIVHPAFVLFVLFGGVLVLRWRWVRGSSACSALGDL